MEEHADALAATRTINVIDSPGAECLCVSNHNPNAVQLHVHHIWPLGMGGPDIPENEMILCPTTHAGVHRLIRDWRRHGTEPPWEVRKYFSPFVRDLAERGWREYQESLEPSELEGGDPPSLPSPGDRV